MSLTRSNGRSVIALAVFQMSGAKFSFFGSVTSSRWVAIQRFSVGEMTMRLSR